MTSCGGYPGEHPLLEWLRSLLGSAPDPKVWVTCARNVDSPKLSATKNHRRRMIHHLTFLFEKIIFFSFGSEVASLSWLPAEWKFHQTRFVHMPPSFSGCHILQKHGHLFNQTLLVCVICLFDCSISLRSKRTKSVGDICL